MTLAPHMVTIDCADPRSLASFWSDAAGYRVDRDFGGEFLVLVPAQSAGSLALGLQRVDEPRTGKNRAHIDWSADDRVTEVERLVKLGATVLAEHEAPGIRWTVLADPEGNEFCVSG